MKKLNNEIINLLHELGVDLVGFCKLEYFKDLENILNKQKELNYKTPFQVGNVDDKVFKNSEYKSAIVIGLPYNKVNFKDEKDKVYLSSVSVGKDYHLVLKDKLKFIYDYLIDNGYKAFIGVDNNIYDERYLAYKAGLGFYGKNNLLINKEYGTYFFIGIILTDAIFDYNEPLNERCFECNKCIISCPTHALNNEGILDGNKCLSYLTQKRVLTKEEESYINKCIYGCDICQIVCPYNENLKLSNNFISDGNEIIDVNEFLNMSEDKYKEKYKYNSSYWRGKKIIDRNIKLYINNKLKK